MSETLSEGLACEFNAWNECTSTGTITRIACGNLSPTTCAAPIYGGLTPC